VALRHRISPVLPLSELDLIFNYLVTTNCQALFLYKQCISQQKTIVHTPNAEKSRNYSIPRKTGFLGNRTIFSKKTPTFVDRRQAQIIPERRGRLDNHTLFGDPAIRGSQRTRYFASPGCPGFALIGE